MVKKTDAVSESDLDAGREAEVAAQRAADEKLAGELAALLIEVEGGPVVNAFKLMGGSLEVFRDPLSRSNRLELRCDPGSVVVPLQGNIRDAADRAAARLILNYAGSPGFIWTTKAVQALAGAEAVTVLNAIR